MSPAVGLNRAHSVFYFPSIWGDPFRDDRAKLDQLREILTHGNRLLEACAVPLVPDHFYARAKEAGLMRPRSAALSTCLGALALNQFRSSLADVETILCVCSNSATSSVAFTYERTGLEEGWGLADPFWLQHAIPTAPATSIFAALKLSGAALGFPGGANGIDSAIRAASSLLELGAARRAIVLLVEHQPSFHAELTTSGLGRIDAIAGAAALMLEPVTDPCRASLDSLSPPTSTRAREDPGALHAGGFRRMIELLDRAPYADSAATK